MSLSGRHQSVEWILNRRYEGAHFDVIDPALDGECTLGGRGKKIIKNFRYFVGPANACEACHCEHGGINLALSDQ
jgi:hypothetical protein